VVDGQYVNLVDTHETVDDAVRRVDNFANQRILEFGNGPTRFRELNQPIRGCEDARDDDDA
jgi:hypothetical protein